MAQDKTRRIGRPGGQTNLSERILDVAEQLFADQGYSGTTLRQVADRAEVNAAMTAYYFQNKENLFRQVFLRRGLDIVRQRMERLAGLEQRPGHGVEDLVRAFLSPPADLRRDVQGRAFLRLHARLHMEPEPISYDLRREVYDVSTRAYVRAFARLMPGVPDHVLFQKMSLMVGAYLYAFSGTHRIGALAGGDPEAVEGGLFEATVAFAVSGICAAAGR